MSITATTIDVVNPYTKEIIGSVPAGEADARDRAVAAARGSFPGWSAGLSGAVFAGDEARALRVARRIRTGQADINGGAFNPRAPFGGVGASGRGRELGAHGLEELFYVKSMQR